MLAKYVCIPCTGACMFLYQQCSQQYRSSTINWAFITDLSSRPSVIDPPHHQLTFTNESQSLSDWPVVYCLFAVRLTWCTKYCDVMRKLVLPTRVVYHVSLFVLSCIEYVWKVARRTSAAPIFFSECDNYVDGGVLANNPCQYGLDEIQKFYHSLHQKLPIALVVSIGTGTYPPEKLGRIDPLHFILPGMHWFKFKNAFKAASNLIQLFSNAVS